MCIREPALNWAGMQKVLWSLYAHIGFKGGLDTFMQEEYVSQ